HPNLRSETVVGGATIPGSAYTIATATQISMPLPDTLVAWPAEAFVSGAIIFPFPHLPPDDLEVTIGVEGPRQVHVPRPPADIADAAALLQAALRISTMGLTPPGPAFQGARVTFTSDGRLVIVPGQLAGVVVVADNPTSQAFKLTGPTGGAARQVVLSG